MSVHLCLDDEVLAAYFDGLLSAEQEQALHREALSCASCQESLAALALIVRDTDTVPEAFQVASSVTERAVALFGHTEPSKSLMRLAVRWLEGALAPVADALQPLDAVAVPTRGAAAESLERFEDLRFHVTVGEIPLEIDLEVDGPEELALTVKPMAPPPSGVLIRLACEGETRAVSSLGQAGATVSSLPPGSYALVLEQASKAMGQLSIELHR